MTWRTPAYLAWVDSGATVAELGARVCVTEADARRAIMGTGARTPTRLVCGLLGSPLARSVDPVAVAVATMAGPVRPVALARVVTVDEMHDSDPCDYDERGRWWVPEAAVDLARWRRARRARHVVAAIGVAPDWRGQVVVPSVGGRAALQLAGAPRDEIRRYGSRARAYAWVAWDGPAPQTWARLAAVPVVPT